MVGGGRIGVGEKPGEAGTILGLIGHEGDGVEGCGDGFLANEVIGPSRTEGESGGGGGGGESGCDGQPSSPGGVGHGVSRRTKTAVPEPSASCLPNWVVHQRTWSWLGGRRVRSNSPLAPELDSQSNFPEFPPGDAPRTWKTTSGEMALSNTLWRRSEEHT